MKKSLLLSAVVGLVVLIVQFPFCGLGIDLEDCYFHLLMARHAYEMNGATLMSCPLTYWLLGWWMSWSPASFEVWWANFGGGLLHGVLGFAIAMFYCGVFRERKRVDMVILLFVLLALQIHYQPRSLIGYYNFPCTLAVLFFSCWVRAGVLTDESHGWLVAMGAVGIVVVLARLTFFPLLTFPALVWLVALLRKRMSPRACGRALSWYGMGILIALALLGPLFVWWVGQFTAFVQESEFNLSNIAYRMMAFASQMICVSLDMLPRAVGYVALVALAVRFARSPYDRICGVGTLLFVVAVSGGLLMRQCLKSSAPIYSYSGSLLTEFYVETVEFVALLLGALLCGGFAWRFDCDDREILPQRWVIVALLLFSFVVPLGSDVYRLKLGYMLPPAMVIAGGVVFRRKSGIPTRCAFGCILVLGLAAWLTSGYLNPIPIRCEAESKTLTLRGMRTDAKRRDVIDKTFDCLAKELAGEKEVLLLSHKHYAPLYILGLTDWNSTMCRGVDGFYRRYRKNRALKESPRYVISDDTFMENDKRRDEILAGYVCLFRSDDLPEGERQNFHYSMWKREVSAVDKNH